MKLMEPKHRPVLDLDQAHSLGLRFCAERNARKLSIQEIADTLLLSKQQVLGLEIGDLKSFYGAKLYAQAADKYAAFLAFTEKPSATLMQSGIADTATVDSFEVPAQTQPASMVQSEALDETSTETIAITAPVDVSAAPRRKTPVIRRLALPLALIAVAGIVGYTQQTTPSTVSPPPLPTPSQTQTNEVAQPATVTQQTREPSPASIETPLEKTEAAASSADVPDGRIELTFSGASWVQAVDKDGAKQEKIYRQGDSLELNPSQLQALIIGNSNAVSIKTAKKTIDLKPYIGEGSQVARIIGSDIRQLGR